MSKTTIKNSYDLKNPFSCYNSGRLKTYVVFAYELALRFWDTLDFPIISFSFFSDLKHTFKAFQV